MVVEGVSKRKKKKKSSCSYGNPGGAETSTVMDVSDSAGE